MTSAEHTEPVSLVHPRAANVAVLAAGPGLTVTEITTGTLHVRLSDGDALEPFASMSLRVDGSFVTLSVPRVLGASHLREALTNALPDGYLVLTHPSDDALIVTIARAWEVEPTPQLFCTSYDTTMRARRVAVNRLQLKGIAKGKGDLALRVNDRELRLRPERGETPLAVAVKLRQMIEATHIVLLSVPSTPEGDVLLTVLPRR
ncbi:MAG TPA: hypothetical protein VGE37_10895 [Archangium sp.]